MFHSGETGQSSLRSWHIASHFEAGLYNEDDYHGLAPLIWSASDLRTNLVFSFPVLLSAWSRGFEIILPRSQKHDRDHVSHLPPQFAFIPNTMALLLSRCVRPEPE